MTSVVVSGRGSRLSRSWSVRQSHVSEFGLDGVGKGGGEGSNWSDLAPLHHLRLTFSPPPHREMISLARPVSHRGRAEPGWGREVGGGGPGEAGMRISRAGVRPRLGWDVVGMGLRWCRDKLGMGLTGVGCGRNGTGTLI